MSLVEKYQIVFDISPVPLLLVAGDGEITLVNTDFSDLFEYGPGELVGKNVDLLVPVANRTRHPDQRSAYNKSPTKRSMGAGRDLFGLTKSGEVLPLELGLEPVTDGHETMSLVTAIDIRHRKMNEQRMHRAMDAAASAMVMVDSNGEIVFVNKAASTLFGYDEAELLDHPVEMLIPEDFRPAHPVYMQSYKHNQSTRSMGLGRDLFARHRSGKLIPVEIVLTPVESPYGTMVMSTIIDLTERVNAQKAAAKRNAELAALNVELSHFAYSASHDLKAPLSSITGLLALCIDDLDEGNIDEVRDNLQKVVEISHRSAQKIEGVLKIARAGRDGLPVEPIDLEAAIRETWLDLTGMGNKTHLHLELDPEASLVTERSTLKVILENILSNALRYADWDKPKHIISVKTGAVSDGISVSITDNGVGIPEDNITEVFQMFKRLDNRSGDGLGLTLVQKQIDRLGGTISVTSKVGEGATFIFTLPTRETTIGQDTGDHR